MGIGRLLTPVAVAFASSLTGCTVEEGASPYAQYNATGELKTSCAETGLLAAPEALRMRVGIRLVGSQGIHWDHGDGIMMGTIAPSGVFTISRYMRVDLPESEADSEASCAIERLLVIEGELGGLPGRDGTYEQFAATLQNDYQTYAGSSCDAFLTGEEPIADSLPCTVSYDVDGARD